VSAGRPVWFRRSVALRNQHSPVTWQGWAVALLAIATVVASLFACVTIVGSRPVAGMLVAGIGIGGALSLYFVALHRHGDA
jgi:hypothetical protein